MTVTPHESQIPASFQTFWQLYLREHSSLVNRWLHVAGTVDSWVVLAVCLYFKFYLGLILVPLVGYELAWSGHAFIERNRPLSMRAPMYSLICDYRLAILMLLGRLPPISGRPAWDDE